MTQPFWETKQLDEMTPAEWESLCDGCGRCCLVKLEDDETGEHFFTDVACKLLDSQSCRCSKYQKRLEIVPDCLRLTPAILKEIKWLPASCAYQLLRNGQPLNDWHPLLSGDPQSVHDAGISVRGKVLAEAEVKDEDLEEHIIYWVD